MITIAVAGASGTVGRHVRDVLETSGHRVVPLTRSDGVDLTTGAGLDSALDGVDAVVDTVNVTTQSARRSTEFFTATTSTLLAAEQKRGIAHHVLLSIVNIDRAPDGYYAGKLRQEQLVETGPVPWTILRATQFHEFAGQILERATLGPFAFAPVGALRPVAAVEVASTLAELANGPALRTTIDLRGPADEQLVDMVRRVSVQQGRRRLVVPIPLPGALGRAMRTGVLRGDSTAREGTITFAEYLSQ